MLLRIATQRMMPRLLRRRAARIERTIPNLGVQVLGARRTLHTPPSISPLVGLDEDGAAMYEVARAFSDNELAPHAARWDEEELFPVDTLRQAASLGFAGLFVAPEHGGSGVSRLHGALVFEALATGCVSTAAYLTIHNMVGWMIGTFGTDEQKKPFPPKALHNGGPGVVLPHGGQRRLGRRLPAHARRPLPRRGGVQAERGKGVHQRWRGDRFVHCNGTDRPGRGRPRGGHGLPGGARHGGPQLRGQGAEAGLAQPAHHHGRAGGRGRARGEPAGGRGGGVQDRHARPGRGPHLHRHNERGGRGGLLGPSPRVHQGAPPVRPPPRRQPAPAVPTSGHGVAAGGFPADDPPRRRPS
mmetsp:Transcript_35613/g.58576  ORF Transcript_35613/g.58576 Transcript_35613/m.58576 type:complete len:356 (+) Transcript_35613:175-1242(+)